ncbi:Xaa-Pro peptidase family protein [Mycobacterium malmoense]|uniref:Peptidase M24 family protein n=1 Tax=Mycobacterium malmoense TaxID=1780 RepID=A0ABX3SQL4_MYCMA|nr:Xaa-Pro peptidase family protein [Mycobacterium malmoense]ORA81679.1 peptidase M24 family protein [Mycobacterium malmoense]QZA19384.1 Xaa-Pro peptidase family protein [Mycobacterium malmoense]UNB96138.1 aminopeptidase P family protein [Mycobacterium malmoense]
MTHSQRRDNLKAQMGASGLDAMLVTDLINVRYLSGFSGSNGALLVFADDSNDRGAVLATDGRYRTQAAEQAPDLEIAIERALGRYLVGRAADAGVGKLGFESNVVTVDGFDALTGELDERKAATELVRAAGTVEALREVKDAGEVALLRLACEAADAALTDLVARGGLRPGRTEREVSRELEVLMLDHGADAVSFETIVAAGPNSAIPHHRPTGAVLAAGDFVKIDFGALVAGYHSDMTRTFVLGKAGKAADWQLEIYRLVAEAQRAGREALRAGAALRDVDAAARKLIVDAGYGEQFGHGLGHGVGLQIHEAPGIGATSAGTLLAGSVVTVEPGVYLPGRGGVRIEDTLVVPGKSSETTGHAPELLTRFPKELAIL